MRSGTNCIISSGEVYSWAQEWLLQAKLVKDHGWNCTAPVVLGIVLRAAARSISVSAACRDLAKAPSDQAVMTALDDGLPKTLPVLERRLNEALTATCRVACGVGRGRWRSTGIWHPYYGQPYKSRNEIYHGQPKQGTTKFHAYASACIVQYGRRYTLALTWVRRHESMVAVLAAADGENPRNRPENQAVFCWIGRFSPCAVIDVFAAGEPAVSDARDVLGPTSQKARKADRPALDQAAAGGLVFAHHEKRQTSK